MQIIRDNTFQSGFRLMGTDILKTGKNAVDILDNCGTATGSPAWRLAQWGSRFSLKNETCRRTDRGFLYSDPAKTFCADPSEGKVYLEILAEKEYDKPRVRGEAWPHLLLAQEFEQRYFLCDLKSVIFDMNFYVKVKENRMTAEDFDSQLHTGQFVWFVTVQNHNPQSPEYLDYFWFGLPQCDLRYGTPRFFAKKDDGKRDSTNKFINSIDARKYLPHDPTKGAVHYRYDAYEDIAEGFRRAKAQGFLEKTEWEDLSFGSMNTGLEMPGTFNLGIEISKIGIEVG